MLPECGLVITSRPTASAYLHAIAHCRVEILGFTKKDRLDYIQHVLQGNDDKIEEVKSYLQSHSAINALCYILLNMMILLSLFEETPSQTNISRLPNTQTEICENFIRVTYNYKIYEENITNIIFPASELFDLPEPHNKVFYELSKLAYDALLTHIFLNFIWLYNQILIITVSITTNAKLNGSPTTGVNGKIKFAYARYAATLTCTMLLLP